MVCYFFILVYLIHKTIQILSLKCASLLLGRPGRTGLMGQTGNTGATGYTGSTGLSGAGGEVGGKGFTGATGPFGFPGPNADGSSYDSSAVVFVLSIKFTTCGGTNTPKSVFI